MAATDASLGLSTQVRELSPDVRAIVQAARRVVKSAVPNAVETGCAMARPKSKSMMWKLCRYGVDGESGYIVAIGAFTSHAAIFFARGAELDDGGDDLEGSGKQLRFFTLKTPADVKRAAVKRVIRKAFQLGVAPRKGRS